MRRMAMLVAMAVLAVAIPFGSAAARASGRGEAVDQYCSESGDYCTFVLEKASGTIVFQIRAFADYFGRTTACVTKDTEVCHARSAKEGDILFTWTIRWQGNYPDEGAGRYTVKWFDQNDHRIGPALHFRPEEMPS
jgi:hypothetical protein